MTNKILIISVSAVIGGIVLLGAGYLAGVSLEKEKTGPQLEELELATKVVKVINSKGVVFVTAFGEVKKTSDRTITIVNGGENLDIRVKEDAEILSFVPLVPAKKGAPTYVPEERKAEFSDIKVGNKVNAAITILPDGSIEAISLIVYSPLIPS
jgi:hypothetical protein